MLPLEAELTPAERDEWLDRVARAVTRRRLEVPAVLALELHRPLTFLGSQALVIFTPLLGAAFGLENLQKLAKLLEDRSNLDRLIDRIEELAAERRRLALRSSRLAPNQAPSAKRQAPERSDNDGG